MFGGAAVYPRTGTTAGTILISSFLLVPYPVDGFVAFDTFSVAAELLALTVAETATVAEIAAAAAAAPPLSDLLSVVD